MKDDELSLEEMALEVLDMLCVALYFAGAKEEHIKELLQIYPAQIDKYFDNLQSSNYGQNEIIDIIKSLKRDYPQFFNA